MWVFELTTPYTVRLGWMQVLDQLQSHELVGKRLSAPSISYGSENLYARGIFEADTRPNLSKVRKGLMQTAASQLIRDSPRMLTSCCCCRPYPPWLVEMAAWCK